MGNFLSLFKELFGFKEYRVLLLGLDASGKTTILYQLKLGEVISTVPTIGFNVETVNYRGITFTIWDICSQERIRQLWEHYIENTNCLIFVIDSIDRERFEEAKSELYRMLSYDELKNIIVLIFANKQDLSNSMSIEEIRDRLDLDHFPTIKWFVQGCSAIEGRGLIEGLQWVKNNIN